ncbi:cell division protein SepF [Nocardioides sp.]|uniref:cell division protein SepF n=1 Tax=Nocardioides sp. TaxID=35761 RepID=UPI0027195465|nr:cell division protein SepF [Nocardioides sp.]MDO9455579.1 cell division protein SepF [Nocardioides sp.]
MSGAMRRIGEYLGLLEDTGRYEDDPYGYDDYDGQTQETEPVQAAQPTKVQRRPERVGGAHPAPVADLAERRRTTPTAVPSPPQQTVAELSRIVTLHPRTYNEARVVGENFRDGTPVIMNLTEMDDNDAKRLVDFAAGLVFATRGTIERITAKVFLLSPPNVSVAAEDKQRIAESGAFFNQS